MSNLTRFAAPLFVAAAALSVAGCGGNKAVGDTEYVARDVSTLYNLAKERQIGRAHV